VLRHVGVYGFERNTLLRIPALPSSGLAEAESLEQLRFLENDIPMQVLDAKGDPWGIETRDDYDAFLGRLAKSRPPHP
jgi:3-deoxy-manno-octulosonate cytidylyltransferase (CMP-KDO synthetase)